VAYVSAIFMSAMDTHIVNVALPTLGRDFDAPLTTIQWTVTGYLLSLALLIPASGWIGDRVGTKRSFLCALGVFTFASALCGAAQNAPELIAARVLQGAGAGVLTPVATAMLYRAYPAAARARIARILIVPILIAPATAPIIGGLLTQELSWRFVFWVNLPVGIITLAYAAAALREHREHLSGRLDVLGFTLSGVGLSLILYAISEGSVEGWGSPPILTAGALGVLSLVSFVRLALRQPEPLLDLRLLGDRLFRATNLVIALNSAAFLGILYLTPIFLQEVHGQTPLGSGLTTFLEAIGVVCASQTVGRLYPRLGPRVMATAGTLALTGLLLLFLLVDADTSLWLIRLLMFLIGAANSATYLSVQSSMFTSISSADTGHASAIYATQRQATIAIGIAILTAVLASVPGGELRAFHAAYLAGAIIAALGAAAAFFLVRTSDARASMVPEHGVAGGARWRSRRRLARSPDR
jgi:EmrB/QacA subfamily drug resistance transporter